MLTRRGFLAATALTAITTGCSRSAGPLQPVLVNDIHSGLNPTTVDEVLRIESVDAIQQALRRAQQLGKAISISGSRHSMGGQQFASNSLLLDMRGLNRVHGLDVESGLVDVDAGIEWPDLISWYLGQQEGRTKQWGIAQKQTGADRLTLGGALSSNIHSRGLRMGPIISDVESFTLIDASGRSLRCSRSENRELFSLAIGGYGLFGVITSVRLRLVPRQKVERVVEVLPIDQLMKGFESRIDDGYLYGDFQFSIDESSDNFLRQGVFSCYKPVDPSTPIDPSQKELSDDDWRGLIALAHHDKAEAYRRYAGYYLGTSGQVYWSDTHQLSTYLDNYHEWLDKKVGAPSRASEMITELYVPRERLTDFMEAARMLLRQKNTSVIYGTIRLIERDPESFLAWARQSYACIIFNLHVVKTEQGIVEAMNAFRGLIDLAVERDGSYFLTYHRWARRDQLDRAYPQFAEFLRRKNHYDPAERFQSEWYRHYRAMFSTARSRRDMLQQRAAFA